MENTFFFGVDIGGTSIKIGLFNENGTIVDKAILKTRKEENGKYILNDIEDKLNFLLKKNGLNKSDILGVGICVPGPVNENGVVNKCVNIGWGVFNVAEAFSEISGYKVTVLNDGNAAAYGEQWQGCAKGYTNVVMVVIGTGIGGGIIVNNKILFGEYGSAGEIGHMTINYNENEYCGCGKKGCLEFYSSATGIKRLAKKYIKDKINGRTVLEEEVLTVEKIFDAAQNGDESALKAVNEASRYLGIALANISTVVDSDMFIIGGGVSNAGKFFIELIKKYYEEYSFHSMKNKIFKVSRLKGDAGMYGCAHIAIDKFS